MVNRFRSELENIITSFGWRKRLLALIDVLIIVMTGLIAMYTTTGGKSDGPDVFASCFISAICCFLCMFFFGAYAKLWRFVRFGDLFACLRGVLCGIILETLFIYLNGNPIYVAYAAVHAGYALVGVSISRYVFHTFILLLLGEERANRNLKRTLIIGGGDACMILLKEPSFKQLCKAVAIVDDDVSKVGNKVCGVEIIGGSREIPKYVEQLNVEQIIFAIPSCPVKERQRILDNCSMAKVPIKTIPFLTEFLRDDVENKYSFSMRDIHVEDLLGRQPISFENTAIKQLVTDKVCMVTGGGGSIGSELVRQIAKYKPRQLIVVDIYENNAYDIEQELVMQYGKEGLNLVVLIASVRDYNRINDVFEQFKPNVVFHAAAHKHVPLMEHSPIEAIKNNIFGTYNVASIAVKHKVEKFVMISTDKAVNPTNVMGATKRCCEMIVESFSKRAGNSTTFVTTRFGNVLGSNGSVIPLFKRQIEQGKAVTVTHPEIYRYFMTIPEAVSLVLEAASNELGSNIYVLDMGEPVKILTLAENLIRMYGKIPYKDVQIEFTGLRPGEKLREELLMDEEGLQKTDNNLIFVGHPLKVDVEQFESDLHELRQAVDENRVEDAMAFLCKLVPTYIKK